MIFAGEAGFEPTSTVLETAELPLFYSPEYGGCPHREASAILPELFVNPDHLSCTNGTATFADSELETLVDSNGGDEFNLDLDVIARHNHLDSLGESDLTGHIQCTDEELGTIVVVERSVTTAFLFLEDVDLSCELGVGSDALRLSNNFTTLHFLLVDTAEEKTHIVTGFSLREELTEHLNTCYDAGARLVTEADEFDRVVDEKISSIGIRKSLSTRRSGRGM